MRLIDADSLIERCEEIARVDWNKKASPVSWSDAYESFISDIEEEPTIEGEPVRQGEWIRKKPNPNFIKELHRLGIARHLGEESIYWICSECGMFGMPHNKYCPNCGAKNRI